MLRLSYLFAKDTFILKMDHAFGHKTSEVALKGLKKLKTLRLINNDIHDISPLSDLSNLDFLILTGNPVDDFSPVSYVKKVVK